MTRPQLYQILARAGPDVPDRDAFMGAWNAPCAVSQYSDQEFMQVLEGFPDTASAIVREEAARLARDPDGNLTINSKEEFEQGCNARLALLCREYPTTDIGNAKRFAARFGGVAKYCDAFRKWCLWDGQRWIKDSSGRAVNYAKEAALKIGEEAESLGFGDAAAARFRWAAASQARARIDAMIYLAQSELPINPKDFDTHNHLLNLQNGTLNLLTYEKQLNRKEDKLTKMAGVEFDPGAKCPRWIAHINLIFDNDAEMVEAFQRVVGYSLLQENPEQVMFILHGKGKNGKSKTIGVLSKILGDYAVNLASESLMSRKIQQPGGAPRSDIARIFDARMVTSSEGESGARLSEGIVKALTGEDTVTVRRLYEQEFEFHPTAKIWFATNHRPIIVGTDDAIWRRIWLIPFTVQIPEEKRDPDIAAKLLQEGPGILNWALDGLKRYRKAGRLIQPEKVKVATQEYREESDPLLEFLDERCEMQGEIKKSDLYRSYRAWCEEDRHDKPVSAKRFVMLLRERGLKEKMTNGVRHWVGIREKGFRWGR